MTGEHMHISFDLVKHDDIKNGKNWWLTYMITQDKCCPHSGSYSLTDKELQQLRDVVNDLNPREVDDIDKYKQERKVYIAKVCNEAVSEIEKEIDIKFIAIDTIIKDIDKYKQRLKQHLNEEKFTASYMPKYCMDD